MAIALDGTPVHARGIFGGAFTVTMPAFSTTQAGDILFLTCNNIGGATITGVSGSTVGAFTYLAGSQAGSPRASEVWVCFAAAALTSEIVTVTMGQNWDPAFTLFALSGSNQTSLTGAFETAIFNQLGAFNGVVPQNYTTTHANTAIVANTQSGFGDNPGPGSGFTGVLTATDSLLSQYKVNSATGTYVVQTSNNATVASLVAVALIEASGVTNYTMVAGLGTITAAGMDTGLVYAPVLPVTSPLFVGRSRLLRRPWLRAMVSMPMPAPPAVGTAYTMAADLGTLTLAGQPAALRSGRKVVADLGTLTLSGQPATLTYSRKISMAAGLGVLTPAGQATNLVYSGAGSKTMLGGLGTITLAGQPVTVRYARKMPAGLGTLTLSGQPATLTYSRKLKMAADLGTITLSGQPAVLRYAHKMAAGLGTLTLAGQPVTLTYSRKLSMTAGLGTLTLAGQNATLTKASSSARVMAAGLGTITIDGQPVTVRYAHRMPAGLGTVTLGGQPAGLRRAKNLTALVGNINLTGQATGLTYTHSANIRMAAGAGTLVLAGQSVRLDRTTTLAGLPGVLHFGRRVTINRW